MSKNPSRKWKLTRWQAITLIYVIGCLVVDLVPHYGPPNFRYTGSDPLRNVWNFGWPLAFVIVDSNAVVQIGPPAVALLLMQSLVWSIGFFFVTIVRSLLKRSRRRIVTT